MTKPLEKSVLNVIGEQILIKPAMHIKQEFSEASALQEPGFDLSEPEEIEQEVDEVIIDCDSTITQKDISALGSDSRVIIVKEPTRGSICRERREKFLNMTPADLPAKKEKLEKCLRPLDELPKPVDQIRCTNCGILFNRSVFAKHEFLCQGKKKKSKFGCMNCSYTHYQFKDLEEHILKEHSKKKNP